MSNDFSMPPRLKGVGGSIPTLKGTQAGVLAGTSLFLPPPCRSGPRGDPATFPWATRVRSRPNCGDFIVRDDGQKASKTALFPINRQLPWVTFIFLFWLPGQPGYAGVEYRLRGRGWKSETPKAGVPFMDVNNPYLMGKNASRERSSPLMVNFPLKAERAIRTCLEHQFLPSSYSWPLARCFLRSLCASQ